MARYDRIGRNYNANRMAEPQLVAALVAHLALPSGACVADIGAGTGNYALALADLGYRVTAVEPAAEMRLQAAVHENIEWHDCSAEALPLADAAADGLMAVLALHHFKHRAQAMAEWRRVAPGGPAVVLTIDPRLAEPFWFEDYFPEIYARMFTAFPPLDEIVAEITAQTAWSVEIAPYPLPAEAVDLTLHSGWNRPELYLDAHVRANNSGFAMAAPAWVAPGVEKLEADLASGAWDEHHGALRRRAAFDGGFRILICRA